MGDKGKKDKGKREQQKKAKLSQKEKRIQKKEKKKYILSTFTTVWPLPMLKPDALWSRASMLHGLVGTRSRPAQVRP